MFGEGQLLLYVGKAKSLKQRLSSYFKRKHTDRRIELMVESIIKIEITITNNETEALLLENTLIKKFQPKYNVVFKDDKSYPYIKISSSSAPRVSLYRGKISDCSEYFGPFPHVSAAKMALNMIQKTFRLRTCDDVVFFNRSRACLLHQIGRCSAPCVGNIEKNAYLQTVRWAKAALNGNINELTMSLANQMQEHSEQLEFEKAAIIRDQIRRLGSVQTKQHVTRTGNANCDIIFVKEDDDRSCVVLGMVRGGEHLGDVVIFPNASTQFLTEQEICANFVKHHYSKHPAPQDILTNVTLDKETAKDISHLAGHTVNVRTPHGVNDRAWIKMGEARATVALRSEQLNSSLARKALVQLACALGFDKLPERIECFDISHTQGESTVASCVVCINGRFNTKEYRRFNINVETPGDDYSAMAQVIRRRFAAQDAICPDIVIVDGGAGQVRCCIDAINQRGGQGLSVIGIAKAPGRAVGKERIVMIKGNSPVQLAVDVDAYRLLLNIRDEAHRFAVSGHRARRAATRKESALENIDGIGPKRRRVLVARFGSLAAIRSASIEEIASLPGIGHVMAEKIKGALL